MLTPITPKIKKKSKEISVTFKTPGIAETNA